MALHHQSSSDLVLLNCYKCGQFEKSPKMFSNIIGIPANLLRSVAIWKTPIAIENIVLMWMFELYRIVSQLMLVYVANILLIAYLTTVEDFDVSESISFVCVFE